MHTDRPCIKCGAVGDISPSCLRTHNYICRACNKACQAAYSSRGKSRGKGQSRPAANPSAEAVKWRKWTDDWKKTRAKADPEYRKKLNARSLARRYANTGRIPRLPCEVCGAGYVEAHHDDYDQPLAVRWLCPTHHRALHKAMKQAA